MQRASTKSWSINKVFPTKSLAFSASVPPQTTHFWLLDKSPLLGPGRGSLSCNSFIKTKQNKSQGNNTHTHTHTHTHTLFLQNLVQFFFSLEMEVFFLASKTHWYWDKKQPCCSTWEVYMTSTVCAHMPTNVSLMHSFPGFTFPTSQIIMVMLNLWNDSTVAGDSSFLSLSLGEAASNSLKWECTLGTLRSKPGLSSLKLQIIKTIWIVVPETEQFFFFFFKHGTFTGCLALAFYDRN